MSDVIQWVEELKNELSSYQEWSVKSARVNITVESPSGTISFHELEYKARNAEPVHLLTKQQIEEGLRKL